MDTIFFPSQYKKAILNKTKNTTIRTEKEIGKYESGKTYLAKSYAGNSWGIKIKVTDTVKTKVGQLGNYGIPDRTIAAMRNSEKLSLNSPVEIIKFKYL